MRRHIGYIYYVLRHKWLVCKAGWHLGVPFKQLMLHDLSKFGRHEFSAYAHAFIDQWGHRKPKQKSPEYYVAWNHHQKSNPHHWQYWAMVQNDGRVTCLEMPDRYIREMLADWTAVSWEQLGHTECIVSAWDDAFEWFSNNHTKIHLHPTTRRKVELYFTEFP